MLPHQDLIHRVTTRHLIRVAVDQVAAEDHHVRVASRTDKEWMIGVLEGVTAPLTRTAGLGNLVSKARRLWEILRKAPSLGSKLKEALGVQSVSELPKVLGEWTKKGLGVMKKFVGRLRETFPISLYFAPKSKMPSLTDLLGRVIASSPKLEAALSKVKTNVLVPLDKWVEKHAPNLTRPLKAAVFVWVWINVAEISWDIPSLVDGFTGKISFGELFGSLPESGIGALLALFGVGYHLLPVSIVARIVWLVGKKYISWSNGSLVVHWGKIRGDQSRDEVLGVAA